MNALPRHSGARSDYGEHEEAIVRYREEGTHRALAMKNRGPLKLDSDGKVNQEIVFMSSNVSSLTLNWQISNPILRICWIELRPKKDPSLTDMGDLHSDLKTKHVALLSQSLLRIQSVVRMLHTVDIRQR